MKLAIIALVMVATLTGVQGCKPKYIRNERNEYHNHTHHHHHGHEHIHKYYLTRNGEMLEESSSTGATVNRPAFLSDDTIAEREKESEDSVTKQVEGVAAVYAEKIAEEGKK